METNPPSSKAKNDIMDYSGTKHNNPLEEKHTEWYKEAQLGLIHPVFVQIHVGHR